MLVDLEWRVTVGEDVQKVIDRNEVESREGFTFAVKILIECFFADFEFSLNFVKFFVHSINCTEIEDVFDFFSFSHDFSHFLIDSHKLP